MKVVKFGGSSLADADQIKKVIKIIQSNRERKVIVVSAPGKRHVDDEKITDLLYLWQRQVSQQLPYQESMEKIHERFLGIIEGLGIDFDIEKDIRLIEHILNNLEGSSAYAASRGEHLCARIMSQVLGFIYIHPEDCIRFNVFGEYIPEDDLIRKTILDENAVIPGFYGAVKHDSNAIRTFSRGGSDLTGALVARALHADVYENWTDVSGLLVCDPRIVPNPLSIKEVTYKELRELSYMGATVFHEEAMFPVQEADIPTNIRNTNEPEHPGTLICSNLAPNQDRIITGIAGRKGFMVITIEKMLMNKEVGFVRKILSILEDAEISFEHMPSGIDTLSIIIDQQILGDKLDSVVSKIDDSVRPDTIKILDNIAMITIVGRAMASTPGIAAQIFSAVARQSINIRMINQGSSELNIIIGVEGRDYELTLQTIYNSVM